MALPVLTLTASEAFAPSTANGSARGPNLNDVQTWGKEMEIVDQGLDTRLTTAETSIADNIAAPTGIKMRQPVRAATTAHVPIGNIINGYVLDGVTLVTDDRVLVKNHTIPSYNGIRIVAASGTPARATDMDSATEIENSVVAVLEGTTQGGTYWSCTQTIPVLETDDVVFYQTPNPFMRQRGTWATSTAYLANDTVSNTKGLFYAKSNHTSGASTEPGIGASWSTYWVKQFDFDVDVSEPLLLPPVFPCVEDQPAFFGTDAMVSPGVYNDGLSIRTSGFIANLSNVTDPKQTAQGVSFIPKTGHLATQTVSIRKTRRRDNLELEVANGTSALKCAKLADLSGTSANVMLIGDSLIDSGEVPYWMKKAGADAGCTITLVGNRTDTIPDGSSTVVNHEGRAGATSVNYTQNASWVGTESYTNPFWDGSAFNFTTAMTGLGSPTMDMVVLALGTNGTTFSATTDATIETAFDILADDLEEMITSIHAYDSNIHIGIQTQFPPGHNQDAWGDYYAYANTWALRKRQVYELSRLMIGQFGGRTGSNIHVLGGNWAIDPVNSFPFDGCHGYMTFAATGNKVTSGTSKATSDANLTWQKWSNFNQYDVVEFVSIDGSNLANRGPFTIDDFLYESGFEGNASYRIGVTLRGDGIVDDGPIAFCQCRKLPLIPADPIHGYGKGFRQAGYDLFAHLAVIGAYS